MPKRNLKVAKRRAKKDTTSPQPYGIVLGAKTMSNGEKNWFWRAQIKRGDVQFYASFNHKVYGGSDAALVMALAYRDALMRLIPPRTTQARSTTLQRRNVSGISGVRRDLNQQGKMVWRADLNTGEKQYTSIFPVARYGESRAKAMAINARKSFLRRNGSRFVTSSAAAKDMNHKLFAELLEQEPRLVSPPWPRAQALQYWQLLDDWFARLRPCYVNINLKVEEFASGVQRLRVGTTDEGWPAKRKVTTISIQKITWSEALERAWQNLQETLNEVHSKNIWTEFSQSYRELFFKTKPSQSLSIRYRITSVDDAQLRCPITMLKRALPDFEIPPLPKFEPEINLRRV